MNIPLSIKLKFRNAIQELDSVKFSIENYLTSLQEEIAALRQLQLSLVANPQVKLYNELVKLFYMTQLHLDNCNVCMTSLEEEPEMDTSIQPQVKSLMEMTDDLKIKYFFLEQRLTDFSTSNKFKAKVVK